MIPTLNGADTLDEVLHAVEAQSYEGSVEVLVIDSSSTDATPAIVRSHPTVRFETIPKSEFGHGRTRQRGAELASGEYVVYLTQDATPIGTQWLAELVAPLAHDGGDFGDALDRDNARRQIPVIGEEVPMR